MNDAIKRLGIFVFYDKDGIVDDYIPYLLNDISENLTDLVIVCNGLLGDEGKSKLEHLSDKIYIRENKGLDAAAWKSTLTEYIGWQKVETYDELVLFNDSFFGPIYPFKVVFDKMADRPIDFWGLTMHGERQDLHYPGCPYKGLPAHIQTYFLVVRKKMLSDKRFISYWDDMPLYTDYKSVVGGFETTFTRHFADIGFNWDVLVDTRDLDRQKPVNYYIFIPHKLLEWGSPVLKYKSICLPLKQILDLTKNEDSARCLEYIRENSDYDVGLIYQHILRISNISDIRDSLHLNYILPVDYAYPLPIVKPKVLIILHLFFVDTLDNKLKYIQSIPDFVDILVTTDTAEKRQQITDLFYPFLKNRLKVILTQNRGRDVAALLVAAKPLIEGYDYVCFCHDKKTSYSPYPKGKSFEMLLWDNMLSTSEYINNILHQFETDRFLGLLVPPWPYYNQGNLMWWRDHPKTKALLEKMGLKADIASDKKVVAVGSVFWCRSQVLKPLLDMDWNYRDFDPEPLPSGGTISHAIERIFPYIAQNQGYYTGWVMTPEYASLEISNLQYLAIDSGAPKTIVKTVKIPIGVREALINFLRRKLPKLLWSLLSNIYHKLSGGRTRKK